MLKSLVPCYLNEHNRITIQSSFLIGLWSFPKKKSVANPAGIHNLCHFESCLLKSISKTRAYQKQGLNDQKGHWDDRNSMKHSKTKEWKTVLVELQNLHGNKWGCSCIKSKIWKNSIMLWTKTSHCLWVFEIFLELMSVNSYNVTIISLFWFCPILNWVTVKNVFTTLNELIQFNSIKINWKAVLYLTHQSLFLDKFFDYLPVFIRVACFFHKITNDFSIIIPNDLINRISVLSPKKSTVLVIFLCFLLKSWLQRALWRKRYLRNQGVKRKSSGSKGNLEIRTPRWKSRWKWRIFQSLLSHLFSAPHLGVDIR